MRKIFPWLVAVLAYTLSASADAQSTEVKALRDQADTDPLNLDNLAAQRRLNDAGKTLARQVGLAFKSLGIPLGPVYTSKFDRAVETGLFSFRE